MTILDKIVENAAKNPERIMYYYTETLEHVSASGG